MDLGMLTFGQIKDHASHFIQDPSETYFEMLGEQINDDYWTAIQMARWKELFGIYKGTVSLSSGNPRFYCPRDVLEALALVDITQQKQIDPYNLCQTFYLNPTAINSSGSIIRWSGFADSCKLTDFSAIPEQITVVSSDLNDVNKSIRFTYLDANGVTLSMEIPTDSFDGTQAVTGSVQVSDLVRISCTDSRTGVISIYGNNSNTVYALLGPRENTVIHKVLYLTPTPNNSNDLILIYKRAPTRMVNDDDVPEIPISGYLRKKAIAFSMEFIERPDQATLYHQQANVIMQQILDNSKAGGEQVTVSIPRGSPRYSNSMYYPYGWRSGG